MANSKRTYTAEEKAAFRQQARNKSDAICKTVSENIIKLITEGNTEDWKKSYALNPAYGLPNNPVTGHKYSGLNQIILMIDMMLNGRKDARYCTYKQASSLGDDSYVSQAGAITLMRPVFINLQDRTEPDDEELKILRASEESDEDGQKKILISYKFFNVHSAEDMENVPAAEEYFSPASWESNNIIDALVESSGVKVVHGTNQARYNPVSDELWMPSRGAYQAPENYYADFLHEYYHSTGHVTRENRFKPDGHSMEDRALEELRAEIFSMMASKFFRLPYNQAASADYIESWNSKCESNPKEIIKQANQAVKILQDVILFAQGQKPLSQWFPEKESWVFYDTDAIQDENCNWGNYPPPYDTRFVESRTEDGRIVFQGPATGEIDPEDIKEGFRIKTDFEEMPGNSQVDVEMLDDVVIVTVYPETMNMDDKEIVSSAPGF